MKRFLQANLFLLGLIAGIAVLNWLAMAHPAVVIALVGLVGYVLVILFIMTLFGN